MLIIEVKNGNIEKALKKYKNKARKTKLNEEIRERQHYTKKSDKRREELKQAEYRNKKENELD